LTVQLFVHKNGHYVKKISGAMLAALHLTFGLDELTAERHST